MKLDNILAKYMDCLVELLIHICREIVTESINPHVNSVHFIYSITPATSNPKQQFHPFPLHTFCCDCPGNPCEWTTYTQIRCTVFDDIEDLLVEIGWLNPLWVSGQKI